MTALAPWIANEKPIRGQMCWVYCPNCRLELTRYGRLIRDGALTDTEGWGWFYNDGSDADRFVEYVCVRCGHYSRWDFDCPAALLIETRR